MWIGAGALGRNSGRVALYFREDLRCWGRRRIAARFPRARRTPAVRERLAAGACFFTDLLVDVALSPEEIQEALWDLAWAGVATNDAFAPLRAPRLTLARAQREQLKRARPRRAGRFGAGRRRDGASAQVQGRWSLTEPLLRGATAIRGSEPRRRALGELLLERYGIVTREQVLAEGIAGGFSAIYSELVAARDARGRPPRLLPRGLGGAQFALPGAVERLRARAAGRHGRGERRSCSPPSIRPSPTARRCPWPKRDGEGAPGRRARPGPPAPTSCWSAASRCSISSAAARRCRRSCDAGRRAAGRRR